MPGVGKSTFAAKLAGKSGVGHLEIDGIFWNQGKDSFRDEVAQRIAGEAWIAEGHFTKIGDLVLARAELVVWLDYPLPLILFRCLKRRRGFFWLLRHWARSRRAFEEAAHAAKVPFVRLRTPQAAETWREARA